LEKPRADRGKKLKVVEKPGADRVDQRKNKRKEEEEEEAIEVLEEDVSDEESVQEEAESPKRRPADRAWLPKASQKDCMMFRPTSFRPIHFRPAFYGPVMRVNGPERN
jgi:hypothetical protein